ncbi:MAG: T9SS type A sorting domain-containing protein [Saprospiraceae bacterium]
MSGFSKILIFSTSFSMAATAYSQDGLLDPTFDNDGIVTTSIGSGNDQGNTVRIQSDGKIVVAGNSGNNLAIARYNENGSLDNTFGTGGIVTTNIGCANASGSDFIIQRDGKYLIGGYCGIFPRYDFALTRYHINGAIDNAFGINGTAITPILNAGDQGLAIAIQNDGKIIQGGYTDNGSNGDFALIRYHSNGALDTSFDIDGKVTTSVGTANDIIRAVAIQDDGKIVVAGYSYTNPSFSYDFVVARYNINGSLDNNFGTGGILTTAIIKNTNDYAESIAIQADGKILVGGYGFDGHLLLARYNVNGMLDNTFGIGGTLSTAFGCSYQNDYSVALQSDGSILLGGHSNLNGVTSDFAVIRYKPNGSIDTNFGINGIVTTAIGSGDDIATSIAIQQDGKIVIAGKSYNGANYDFALVRYNNTLTTGINVADTRNIELKILPNPFSTETTIQSNISLKNATIVLYNSLGIPVKSFTSHSGNSLVLSRDLLPIGVYFIQISQGTNFNLIKKLLIMDH